MPTITRLAIKNQTYDTVNEEINAGEFIESRIFDNTTSMYEYADIFISNNLPTYEVRLLYSDDGITFDAFDSARIIILGFNSQNVCRTFIPLMSKYFKVVVKNTSESNGTVLLITSVWHYTSAFVE